MLMDASFIPEYMRRALGSKDGLCAATRAEWDHLSKQFYEIAMGAPPGLTWLEILIPSGMSLDNAPPGVPKRSVSTANDKGGGIPHTI